MPGLMGVFSLNFSVEIALLFLLLHWKLDIGPRYAVSDPKHLIVPIS